MYNRYIPQSDGSYQKNRMQENRRNSQPQKQEIKHHNQPSQPPPADITHIPASTQNTSAVSFLRQLLPRNCDTADLLIILLLLLIAGDCEDEKSTALLTLAFYFFL